MKKRYLRLAALTAGVLLAAQTGLFAAALSTFDAAYYAAQYPDVAAVCGNDEGALLRHYLDHGIDEGRKPSADGIAGDDELSLTEAQFSSVWSPVAINKLAHYKSLKRKCTDEEFAQAYQEALKVVTPLEMCIRDRLSMMQATGSPLTAGISSTAIVVLSRIMTVFSFALVMLRTLYAKWLYRKSAAERIRRIRAEFPDAAQRRAVLSAQGGVSIAGVIGACVLLMVLGACATVLMGPNLDALAGML